MATTVEPIARLIEELARLPGIGPKTAQRLTFFLLRQPKESVLRLSEALVHMKERTTLCSVCLNLTDVDPCPICRDERRDASIICVIEEPLDILAIERSREYRGKYHVLHGSISPMEGVGPDDLKITELLRRLGDGAVEEVILATNPNVEGEATAAYLARLLRPLGVKISRIARGLPAGADLEYADDVTLASALEGRRPM